MELSKDILQFLFFTGFGGWLALSNIQHGKKLAVMEKVLDALVLRIDLFIKTEVDTLKELVKKN
jgi:hypothetical protein